MGNKPFQPPRASAAMTRRPSVLRRLHGCVAAVAIAWLVAGADSAPAKRRLVVLGDSLAAGYGVERGEGWPERVAARIDKSGLPFEIVNAGVSGDTTAGGLRRLDWVLRQPLDVLVVELGGNDGLRGIAPATTQSNLVAIIRRTRARWPSSTVVVAGMQMPPSMGAEHAETFRKVFEDVAREEKTALIPHLLEGVGGVPELNQDDLIHPTPAGHELVASNAWVTLEPVLRRVASPVPKPAP
jgi:acyl-CoA thioesterase-1